jgi:octaprenyl-diphosphate synthase
MQGSTGIGGEAVPREDRMALTATTLSTRAPVAGALERLIAAVDQDMGAVNAMILKRADSHVAMVPELARYLIEAGGKRLRPMLVLAAAQLFGGGSGSQVNFAAAIEFLHNATLLHDDVVDESAMRRGKPAARMIWGNQASVLVGDFLLGQAFMMMVETGDLEALAVIAKASAVIAEGEVFQLAKTGDLDTTPADYHEVIRAKTATLFEAATEIGAKAGGANAAGRKALRAYGLELGLAFQLVDDVLDFRGESGTLGKNTGDDLREGKMTLPVILTLAAAKPAERALIVSALGKPEVTPAQLGEIIALMERYGALERTLETAVGHAAAAREALKPLPASDMKALLAEVADFCVARAY